MNRSKKGFLNMFSHLLDQAVTAVCGFIVPKLVLESFGSEVNGMVASITQFLGVIALMESGFGSVAKTAFFSPLAANDLNRISGVFNATQSFFRKIAFVFAGYCVLLSFVFPLIRESSYDYWFVLTLVLILGAKSFMQYYFGLSYTILANADQSSYVSGFLQIAVVVLNAVLTVVLINSGASVHIVKLVSSCVFILKPISMNIYGKSKYRLNKYIPKDTSSLSQKWSNFGQSIAYYIHSNTDAVLITLFLNFSEVSVYSVYSIVTKSLSSIITSISSGFVSGLGNMYAKGEKDNFDKVFSLFEFVNTAVSFLFYTMAFVLVIPFVKVYTANVADVDYIRPTFAAFIVISELVYCLRLPYHYMTINAGHFKQIQWSAYVEAALNIVLSLILINFMGITGLVIGTGTAMLFRTAHLALYCSKHIIKRKVLPIVKRIIVNLSASAIAVLTSKAIICDVENFFGFFVYAIIIGAITLAIFGILNFSFFGSDVKTMFNKIKSVVAK